MTQKYTRGDIIKLKPSSSWNRSHPDAEIMILQSYKEQFGGTNTTSYTCLIRYHDEASWFREGEFELVEQSPHLEAVWRKEIEEKRKIESSLEWVFDNAEVLSKRGYSQTVLETLGKVIGINDLWGSRGEGLTYYTNAHIILEVATPYLEKGDINGYRKLTESLNRP